MFNASALPTGNTTNSITIDLAWFTIANATILTNFGMALIILSKQLNKTVNITVLTSMSFVGMLFAIIYLYPRLVIPDLNDISPLLCSILPQIGHFTIINLNFHVCLISLDKFYSVSAPFSYQKHATVKKAIVAIVVIWFISVVITTLPLYTFRNIHESHKCISYSSDLQAELIFQLFIYSTFFFLPLLIIIVVYGRLIMISCKITSKSMTITVVSRQCNQSHSRRAISTRNIVKNRKAIVQTAVIIGIFIVLQTPFVIAFLVIQLDLHPSESDVLAIKITRFLAFSYPGINPLVYAYYTADIKSAITRIFHRSLLPSQQQHRVSKSFAMTPSTTLQLMASIEHGRQDKAL
ncbi:Alpha-1A adrenergic receptor [Trichoplax sp. H2]|uniref:G-protein coupled receptors family 1 profile domain-containing protein n=1 Tax=Trichoplax adhaerens TaxID=10228 RepID=B3RIV6_TRIAD|nr:hypothetical protein TRIADDRAFT_51384 [Trichoplax adhaerens]EDV28454.1 hypothetical protein TRIADDRAFT_51384 [Trichoplax adhaerens]RDD36267.1 Alpha-1A adrenergic receptor [Trichoplax sp. H2]|eukprot:XP_002107656.1 hypothetical protein TRIADDRAFT_51384 [Trichoplax adhaerens]